MRRILTTVPETGVTLDANYPMVGEDLTFDLHWREIVLFCLALPGQSKMDLFYSPTNGEIGPRI